MSFSGRLAYRMLKTTTNIFPFMKTKITDIEKELEKSKKINEKNKFALPSDKKSLYKEINVSGHPCLIIRSKKIENKKDRAILFIYGGITRQWKTELAMARGYGDRTGMDVWYPIYPPITEVNITITINMLCETYCKMVKKYGAEHIAIVGDSMGGLFAAGIINQINRSKLPVNMPKLFIANSPAGVPDTNEDWEEMSKYALKDPIFDISAFRGIGKIATYSVETPKHIYCPIHMDFNNSPETYMYFAEEACAGNARAYQIAYDRAGVGAKLHIHIQPEMMHGYSSVPVFPESKRSFNEAIKLLNEV